MKKTPNPITLNEYTKNWFRYESCPYIQAKIRRGGHFSRSMAEHKRRQMEMYILPSFGSRQLQNITEDDIETWLFSLKDRGFSHTTINHIYDVLRLIIKEAHRKRIIDDDPSMRVRPFIATPREKGTITQEEAERLFRSGALKEVWKGHYVAYLMNLTSSQTGMRLGEIQALHTQDVHEDYIFVCRAWERKFGEKGTKSGVNRTVPIPRELSLAIRNLGGSQDKGPYVFSFSSGMFPADHKCVYKHLYRALERIGISREERKERNITFHSWRHYYNSLLRLRGVPDHITQMIIGHSNDRMTEHYTHVHPEEMAERFSDLSSSVTIEGPGDG